MELIQVTNNQIALNEEVSENLKQLYQAKIEFDVMVDRVKNSMLEVMETNGIKSFENDFLKITYVAPTTRKTIDSNALKEQGLYEMFLKDSPVKSSVKVSFK
jgi:hypothetical protein